MTASSFHLRTLFALLCFLGVSCSRETSSGKHDARPVEEAHSEQTLAGESYQADFARVLAGAQTVKGEEAKCRYFDDKARGMPRALYPVLVESLGAARPGSDEDLLVRAVLARWAFEEPTSLAAWSLRTGPSPYIRLALALASRKWVSEAPQVFTQWASQLPQEQRDWALTNAGDWLAVSSPQQFQSWYAALPPGRERNRLLRDSCQRWAESDLEGLLRACADTSLELAEWRGLALNAANERLLDTDPELTANLFVRLGAPEYLDNVMGRWAIASPQDAVRWIDQLADPAMKSKASSALVSAWLEKDPASALSWLSSQDKGVASEQLISRVVDHYESRDPAQAVEWSLRLPLGEVRESRLASLLKSWHGANPESLRAFLAHHPEIPVSTILGDPKQVAE